MKKRSILIADDNSQIIRLVVGHFSNLSEQWRVLRAGNGEEAVKVAQQEVPDLIMMDWDMPVMDGIQATRKIRTDTTTAGIPIIMATGEMISAEDLQMALEAGAWDYVRKPLDLVELSARIHAAIRLKDQQEENRKLLQQEIDLKNRKLSTTSMLIVEKNGIIGGLNETLEALIKQQGTPQDPGHHKLTKELVSLKKRLFHHLEADESWLTFRIHFDEVHPTFFSTLNQLGDISHKDLKLAAYLKLGMETKDIAQLLNVTPASIRTAMYRLKKRLGLEDEIGLREYLVELG